MSATATRGSGTLFEPDAAARLTERLCTITPASRRHWGRMTAHQMVCHLSDSFLGALGERPCEPVDNLMTRSLMRWFALHLPVAWPKGRVATLKEVDQEVGGTPPAEFEADRRRLEELIRRFAEFEREVDGNAHPIFGPLNAAEWGAWGYRHLDHHLRQFGA